MSMYDNKLDKGVRPRNNAPKWYKLLPPPGYVVEELRDFTQPMPEDGSCALCGRFEDKCPCYVHN